MNTWDFSPSLMMALIRKGGRTMPIDTHNDRTPMSETEESCDTAKTDSGIPENNPLGKKGGPAGEHSSEASAAAHSSHIDISGNTSTTLIPIRILTTPDLESQGDHGREIEVISEEEGKELQAQNRFGIGIDVHSKFFVTSVLVRRLDKVILYTKEFKTSYNDIKKAKEWAVSTVERYSDPPVLVGDSLNYCIESTSTYHMPIIHVWEGKPAVVNPMLAKSGRRKTDVLDSIQLAIHDLYGTWARSYVVPVEVHELRVLIHEREHYEKLSTQCVNRIVNTLTRFGCTLAREGSIANDPKLRSTLEGMLADPPIIPKGYFPKGIPPSVRQMLREELEAHDVYEQNALAYKEAMIEKARSIMWDFGEGTAPGDIVIKTLATAPNIGEVTAVTFLANIVTPKRFPKPKAIAAYCGFDPSVQTSAGHKTSNKGRGGNKALHDAIGSAATRLIWRHREMFGKWGYDMIQRGTSHNKARNAVARRLVISLYYMLLKGEAFSYEGYNIAEKNVLFNIPVDDLVLFDKKYRRYIHILKDNEINDTRKLIIEYYSCTLNNISGLGRKFFQLLKDFIDNQKAYKKEYESLKNNDP